MIPLPSRFIYCGIPCLSCGAKMVLNGPALTDAEHMERFERGEAELVSYKCTACPEIWGFYGERHPEGPQYEDLLEAMTA